jgi:hypothetical protein
MKRIHLLAGLAWLTLGNAVAHEATGPNGGQLRDAGVYHVELVLRAKDRGVQDATVLAYVFDSADRALPSAGLKGKLVLLMGKDKVSAELVPDGDNRLRGSARFDPSQAAKAVVTLTLPQGRTVQARFELPAPGK